ncbi:hypothetical protein [Cryptosporangium sp. NPDC048952]|uniref:hypothetical protein n=1 Tax=Cryptosporangium sp. NPDC048952 TaxID=3363961 RepID=UPI003713E166
MRKWIEDEEPPPHIADYVRAWIALLKNALPSERTLRLPDGDTPQVGEFWYADIPASDYNGLVVRCGYWNNPRSNQITCAWIASCRPLPPDLNDPYPWRSPHQPR